MSSQEENSAELVENILNKPLENLRCSETSTPRMARSITVAGAVMTSTPTTIQRSISEEPTSLLQSTRPHSSSLTTLNSDDNVDGSAHSKANLTISTVSDQVRIEVIF